MEKDREQFLRKVNKNSGRQIGTLSECWLWTGKPHTSGYGNYQSDYSKHAGTLYAHQAAYHFFKDPTYRPSRENPCSHRCEGGEARSHSLCVNPDHLYIAGSIKENIADRDAHLGSYQPKGAKANNSKFTEEQIKEIRALRETGMMYKDIAAKFTVNRRTIERICLNRTYAVNNPAPTADD
jgi:hypothetical protein